MRSLASLITDADAQTRNQSLDAHCREASAESLLRSCAELDEFRRRCENLYERVRALFFLYAIHRFHLPSKLGNPTNPTTQAAGLIPFKGYEHLLRRRFQEAIDHFLAAQSSQGPNDALCSALAAAYHRLAFQTLADQVRRSVRSVRGNQWMFRMGHPADQPLRLRPELLRPGSDGSYPILRERTPVRMDLTHCGWSDIFFLGMDYPEGAKVLNVSIDLGVHGRDAAPRPPVEALLRVIEEPLLRLTSVDLGATADLTSLADVFDFAKDYLGLLKAAVIASGLVPPGIEGSGQSLAELLARIVGAGRGLEIVSHVNDIPKGSRLAVSTNLLAALISVCMRATGQTSGAGDSPANSPAADPAAGARPQVSPARAGESPARLNAGESPAPLSGGLTGTLSEPDRRLVLARALLGEWLGGSGGGWQDSGGVWPGMKLITGVLADEGDPEWGISRGRLMPTHRILGTNEVSSQTRRALQESLVLVHGGMAQNVGPILEMVTEKYLLRCEAEWDARGRMLGILDEILGSLRTGDVRAIGAATTRSFFEPIQTIIPWASTLYTETLIAQAQAAFEDDFWGFWMLGGMSGGGMGFIFAPERKAEAQRRMQEIMSATKRELHHALPFAMEPVVYDFAINERGTCADLLEGGAALMPAAYYSLIVPLLLRTERHALSPLRRAELDKFGAACRARPELRGVVQSLFDAMLPRGRDESSDELSLAGLLEQNGFDRTQHEQIRADLKEGRIGLAQNRLPASAVIEDVQSADVVDATQGQSGSGAGDPACLSPAGDSPAAPQANPFTPFDKNRPATITQRRLPHWTQEGCTYFVTFRLADSLPATFFTQWHREKDQWITRLPQPVSQETLEEATALFSAQFEDKLDEGHGACPLKTPAVAALVENCIRHFDQRHYWLGSYVIMPNHVHVLVRPIMGHDLSSILQNWKSVSSHQANRLLNRTGGFWQEESFDHIVRDEQQMERFGLYIAENPGRARLKAGEFLLGSGAAARQPQAGAVAQTTPSAPVLQATRLQDSGTTMDRQASRLSGTMAGESPAPLQIQRRRLLGEQSLRRGELAIVTLAAGAGSRWTQGAGVVKALHPFCKLGGRHRTFIETHLAKSRRVSRAFGAALPHVLTTSYLTHAPLAEFLAHQKNYGYDGPLWLSPGKAVGLRLVPTVRDLRFAWEEMPQQILDEQQQKVRDSLRNALIGWARSAGEAADYTDNLPLQCLHPVGHWYEVANLFRNGVLARLLSERPQLQHLLLHNIDTLGADADPALLGLHIETGACLTFEVITRRIEDRGGGLARVNGRVRLVEGLAMPREEDEFRLSYYNSMTTWIHLDKLLAVFGLTRGDILRSHQGVEADDSDSASARRRPQGEADEKISAAIRALAAKMPTYITLKEVKKRWGHGQEDVFPVAQFEKLWGDMTALPEIDSRFVAVPRLRGQQLKDPAQLDGWLRDGSAAYVEALCEWA